MSRRKREKEMRRILMDIENGEKVSSFSDGDAEYIMDIVDKGLLRGLTYTFDSYREPVIRSSRPTLTYEGRRFLKQKHPRLKENISLTLSIIALLISFISMSINLLANLPAVLEGLGLMSQLLR